MGAFVPISLCLVKVSLILKVKQDWAFYFLSGKDRCNYHHSNKGVLSRLKKYLELDKECELCRHTD